MSVLCFVYIKVYERDKEYVYCLTITAKNVVEEALETGQKFIFLKL